MEKSKITIYGDSLMRGTVIDENMRYHATISDALDGMAAQYDLEFVNRARFGITIEKGSRLLKNDLQQGHLCKYALVEFGGNDCSFLWDEVSAQPEKDHQPLTRLDAFEGTCTDMVKSLENAGVQPVLMTLPPIDAEKHLAFLGKKGNDQGRILRWLGDVQMIYRFHELYSNTIGRVAKATGAVLIDVRAKFLDKHNMAELVGQDGVHPSLSGYQIVYGAFAEFIAARKKQLANFFFADAEPKAAAKPIIVTG